MALGAEHTLGAGSTLEFDRRSALATDRRHLPIGSRPVYHALQFITPFGPIPGKSQFVSYVRFDFVFWEGP